MNTLKIIFAAALTLTFAACSNNGNAPAPSASTVVPRQHFIDEVKKYEGKMHQSMQLDPGVATFAVKAYNDFATQFPNDSLTPGFLFKAGEVSTANRQYPQALQFYRQITGRYPNYKLYPESLYLQAYLLDNFLNQDEQARPIYEQVIAKYPDLPYAKDAQAAISHLGKSDEELIREFEKKNKKR